MFVHASQPQRAGDANLASSQSLCATLLSQLQVTRALRSHHLPSRAHRPHTSSRTHHHSIAPAHVKTNYYQHRHHIPTPDTLPELSVSALFFSSALRHHSNLAMSETISSAASSRYSMRLWGQQLGRQLRQQPAAYNNPSGKCTTGAGGKVSKQAGIIHPPAGSRLPAQTPISSNPQLCCIGLDHPSLQQRGNRQRQWWSKRLIAMTPLFRPPPWDWTWHSTPACLAAMSW